MAHAVASRVHRLLFGALLLGVACQRPAEPAADAAADAAATAARTAAESQPVPSREEARRLGEVFETALTPVAELTAAQLEARHTPSFLPAHGLDVTKAEHYAGFVDAFALSEAERERLATLGFVVVPARDPGGAGPADLYYRVFAADLPVFVSADSVLHAWHRSYDDLLEHTEEGVLVEALERLLSRTDAALDPTQPDQRDAGDYLAVARVLLASNRAEAGDRLTRLEPILRAIESKTITRFELMGAPVLQDFSQMIPRGHYTHSKVLERYFRAMMWLGRVELRLWSSQLEGPPNPREEAAARALAAALARSGQRSVLEQIDGFYRLHVGRTNALTPLDLMSLCDRAGAPDCSGEVTAMPAHYAAQGSSAYHSRLADPEDRVVAMRLFPQRFAYDAWVTDQTTAPRMPSPTDDAGRTMASPYDVAFALGSDRALLPLAEELRAPLNAALPGRLAAARQTLHTLAPIALDETIYNHWLEGLMTLARTDLDPRLPRVMQTAAWHDRRMEAVLASWTELRHDTVLVVEQSMGFMGCQYPKGYVEPVPELYRQLGDASAHLVDLYRGEPSLLASSYAAPSVLAWGQHFGEVMERLARLSEQQLRGEPMSEEDLAFLNRTVDRHEEGYGGSRQYDGWYAALYWTHGWQERSQWGHRGRFRHYEGGESEPVVTDVHTDAMRRQALEVGTGHPELLVVVVDQGDDVALYGGPASSFYAFERPIEARMTDNEWQQAVQSHALPDRPAFARTYRAQ